MPDLHFKDIEEFWPYYVSQHRRLATRRLHFAGTTLGLGCLFLFIQLRRPWLLALGLFLAYGLAWVGHFFVEKNAPATFKHPVLSFRADFRMYRLMLLGRMDREVARLSEAGG